MNDERREASIRFILDSGLVKPQSAPSRVREVLSVLGLRFIFWDAAYAMVYTLLTIMVILISFIVLPIRYRATGAVAIAPALFLAVTLFAETSERACGLYELKQTFRYNVRTVGAIRMMCCSAAGAVFAAVAAAFGASGDSGFLEMYCLCLTALFLCAAAEMAMLRHLRGRWAAVLPSLSWVLISGALALILGDTLETFLLCIPPIISIAAAAVSLMVLVYQIKIMMTEGAVHAYA